MAKKTSHTLSYLLARTSNRYTRTLQEDLADALKDLPDVDMRKVPYKDKILTGTVLEERDGMVVLQLAASAPGEQASTLPSRSAGEQQVTLGTLDAPEGHDFSDGDLICLIDDNDIFVCASGMRDNMLYPFLVELFKKQGKDVQSDDWSLDLVHGADRNVMRQIQKHHIKSIRISAVVSAAQISDYTVHKNSFFSQLLEATTPLSESAANADAKVSLTVDRVHNSSAKLEWLEAEAGDIVAGNADYIIRTMDGDVFTPEKIIIKRYSKFTPYGKSVFLDEAISRLKEFRRHVQNNE